MDNDDEGVVVVVRVAFLGGLSFIDLMWTETEERKCADNKRKGEKNKQKVSYCNLILLLHKVDVAEASNLTLERIGV